MPVPHAISLAKGHPILHTPTTHCICQFRVVSLIKPQQLVHHFFWAVEFVKPGFVQLADAISWVPLVPHFPMQTIRPIPMLRFNKYFKGRLTFVQCKTPPSVQVLFDHYFLDYMMSSQDTLARYDHSEATRGELKTFLRRKVPPVR